MSKLNNVKAINQMIRGEHRTQTRKSKGYEKKTLERKIGDSWIDDKGQKWIQKNGYKLKVGKLSTIRKVQELHNSKLDIEGLLLTMYDSRLKLSNLVIEQVKLHFPDMVYDTIIQRNVRLSEATGHCKSIIKYDATSRGAINYLNLAQEFLEKSSAILNKNLEE